MLAAAVSKPCYLHESMETTHALLMVTNNRTYTPEQATRGYHVPTAVTADKIQS